MKNFVTGVLTIASLSIATSFAVPAAAEDTPRAAIPEAGTGIQSISIQYAPAVLSTDEGRANLYGKIKHAAGQVCGPTGLREAGSLAIASRNRKCVEDAMAAAMGQVDSSQLAAIGH